MSESELLRQRLAEATGGEYEILHELGRGGMAVVFAAHDLALDRRVAIKLMAPQLVAVEGMAERFLQEARVAASLAHPHIIPIHAVRRRGDLLWFVMKFVAGRSLDGVVAEHGPLPVPVVRAILTQVGSALEAAHQRGIVHRDIKPANILIDEHGDAVVADFGIARLAERPGTTQAGQTVGTPEYMSPEQCAGEALGGAADQYSLGVVAYELLTGAPPFTGENLMQVVWRMVHEEVAPLASRRADCPPALAAAVHRMLARRAEGRFARVAEAVAALPPLALAPDDPVRRELVAYAKGRTRASSAATVVSGATGVASAAMPAARDSAPDIAVPAVPVAALRFAVPAGVMTIDDEVRLVPEARDAEGAPVEAPTLAWRSSDPAVARVDADGRLVAVAIGRATITAQAGDAMAALGVVVTRAGARALQLAPRPATLEVGDRLALQAVTGEAEGLLPHPRLVAWESSDQAIATVDAIGRVTARAEGQVEIRARAGGVRGSATFRVTKAVISAVAVTAPSTPVPVGARLQLAAAPANTKGHPLPDVPVRWEVSDPAIAAVSPDGVLTALRHGQVLVAARAAGRVGTARVVVSAGAR